MYMVEIQAILEGSVKSCLIWNKSTQLKLKPSDLHRQRHKERTGCSVWVKSACVWMLQCAYWYVFLYCMCTVYVCNRWHFRYYFFSVETKVESQLHAVSLHCFIAYTLTLTQGIIIHFPYLSMTMCVLYVHCSLCVNGGPSSCDRWAPIVAVHMGVAQSPFWMR